MPLFSIITAVFNNEKFLLKCSQSILNQDFKDFEYIIVDDGSTDNTSKIADEIAKSNTRVKVIHQNNQWIYASFNNGIHVASGKYIYIVNSDDILAQGALTKMGKIVSTYDPDVIWTNVMMCSCEQNQNVISSKMLGGESEYETKGIIKGKDAVHKAWMFLYKNNYTSNQANLYRRKLLIKHPFRNDVFGADALLNISIAEELNSCYILYDPIYRFMMYKDSSMNASIGKYYSYEHEMQNEIYCGTVSLLKKWNCYSKECEYVCCKKRLSILSHEFKTLIATNCPIKGNEKIRSILTEYIDNDFYNLVVQIGLLEELEARVLSGINSILNNENITCDCEEYFIYEMLQSLMKFEKTEHDIFLIKSAVFNPINKYMIGKTFYKKIISTFKS